MPNPHNYNGPEWIGYAKVDDVRISLESGKIRALSIHKFSAQNDRPNNVEFEIAYTHKLWRNHGTDEDPDWQFERADSRAVNIPCAKGATIEYQGSIGDIDYWRDTTVNKPSGTQTYKVETYTKVTPKAGFTNNAGNVKAELDKIETFD